MAEAGRDLDVAVLPGACTPTGVQAAYKTGVDAGGGLRTGAPAVGAGSARSDATAIAKGRTARAITARIQFARPLSHARPMRRVFLSLCLAALAAPAAAQVGAATDSARAVQTARFRAEARADRQRMMDRLGVSVPAWLPPPALDPRRPAVTARRPGRVSWYDPAGNRYARSDWGTWSNYDESLAGGGAPLDPLVMADGTPVESAADWWRRRRPEITESYLARVYGRVPADAPSVAFDAVGADSSAWDGRALVRHVVGAVDNARYPAAQPRVDVTLYLPVGVEGPVPVVVRVGGFDGGRFDGGGAGLPDPVRQALERGWAFATVDPGPVQMDSGAGLGGGVIGLVNRGQPRAPDDWGALAAWAWGAGRALDYLETVPGVDATRAAVQGHSRWGKTALLAGAMDPRWAAVYASCSGAMGASLEKRNWGETMDDVAGAREYHWMAGTFLEYAGRWDALPGDAHFLMALVAPRPLLVTGGTDDPWSDPHGSFLAAAAASPVYEFLGARGLGATAMPAPDVALVGGALAFRVHDGGHTDAPDWPVFYEWVARFFAPH